jgi:hypothetical protein
MASKSRFGYFSILPSHTAAITDYAQKKGNPVLIQPKKMKMEKLKHKSGEFIQGRNRRKY